MDERQKGIEAPDPQESTRKERVMEKFGMHIPRGKEDRLHLQPRFFKFLGFLGILVLIFSAGMFEFSTSPYFCASCHIMKPYYQAWKTSKHNHVPCVDCHYPPEIREKMVLKFQALSQVVKYVTRTYSSKPYAEISDASCLRKGCHETRLLQGEEVFTPLRSEGKSPIKIKFDHGPHLTEQPRGKKLRCTSCHSQIVVGNHMEVTESTCFLCHFKGTKVGRVENPIGGCGNCHTAPEGDIKIGDASFNHKEFVGTRHVACQNCHLEAIQGEGEAKKERCIQCHNEPARLARYADTEFMHRNHVTNHNIECTHCHEPIQHAVKTTVEPLQYDCTVCHEKKHNIQKQIYMGIGARSVRNMPSPMFMANVDCVGCHLVPKTSEATVAFLGQTFQASEAACLGCHGEDYKGVLGSWREEVGADLARTKPLVERARGLLRSADASRMENRKAVAQARDAEYNYLFILYGKGIHNVDYAKEVLGKARADSEAALSKFSGKGPGGGSRKAEGGQEGEGKKR
jgi:nitrate/TMAO reductase-like tetraheme cytochrome c subunit